MHRNPLRILGIFVFFLHTNATASDYPLLVKTDWLRAKLNHTNIHLVDARSKEHFELLHIANAANIPVEETFSEGKRKNLVAPISKINELLNHAGISNHQHIIVYDDGQLLDATRLFWVLEVYGIKKVSVLDGGFNSWLSLSLPTQAGPQRVARSHFKATIVPSRIATKLTTRLAMDSKHFTIIDARSKEEYLGKKSKAKRFGHIPGAVNIPATNNFIAEDGLHRLRSKSELADLYRQKDIKRNVITYCNRGKESATIYFVLRNLGYNVSAYDGSWLEWANDQHLPVTVQ